MSRVRVITERDERRAAKDGTRELDAAGAVVTPSAEDVARAAVTLKGARAAASKPLLSTPGAKRTVALGIMVDGAGIGSCLAANKIAGARAAMSYDVTTAQTAREHDNNTTT